MSLDLRQIDVCYSGAQKCLSCPPGVSPITFNPRAVELLETRRTPVSNWYLDCTLVQKYWGKERTYHHTAPISANYAVYQALSIVAEEGLEARWSRHRRNAERLWQGLENLGLTLHVPIAYRLPTLTTVRVPEGVDETQVRLRLLNEYNIEIGGGLGRVEVRLADRDQAFELLKKQQREYPDHCPVGSRRDFDFTILGSLFGAFLGLPVLCVFANHALGLLSCVGAIGTGMVLGYFVDRVCRGLRYAGRIQFRIVDFLLFMLTVALLITFWTTMVRLAASRRCRQEFGTGRWRQEDLRLAGAPPFTISPTGVRLGGCG